MSFSNNNERDLILKIYKVKNDNGSWCPAIEDIATHDIDPLWIAGVMYCVFSRYIDCVDESSQLEFQETSLNFFKYMVENGEKYIERITETD